MTDVIQIQPDNDNKVLVQETGTLVSVEDKSNNTLIVEVQLQDQVIVRPAQEVVVVAINDGNAAMSKYWISRSATTIKKTVDGYNIPFIVLEAYTQSGSGDIDPYAGIFKVTALLENGIWIEIYNSSAPEISTIITVPANCVSINYKLYSAINTSTKLDEENTTVIEDGVSFDLRIISTNGTIFRVNESRTTMLIAKVFRNGLDVTDQIPDSKFKWTRVSVEPQPYPNDDASWNAAYQTGYKQILVSVDDVDAKATFFCELHT